MKHKALLRQLQISCLGLDAVDPLRLLVDDVIAALAQHDSVQAKPEPEQEPVAKCTESDSWNCKYCRKTESCKALQDPRNFTTPPQRTWVGLTESERRLINFQWQDGNGTAPEIIDLVEAKLKDKNT